jgi:Zn finger protein HypA/HybF involved in hydrogenase expression
MSMRQADLTLDGNAIAGLLREIFTMEMTTAESTCAGCGKVHAVGRVEVYLNAPGAVVRCPSCRQVLMRIVHGRGRYWLDMTGIRCLVFTEPTSA